MGRCEADYAAARAHHDTLKRLQGSAEAVTMRWSEPPVLAATDAVVAWLQEMDLGDGPDAVAAGCLLSGTFDLPSEHKSEDGVSAWLTEIKESGTGIVVTTDQKGMTLRASDLAAALLGVLGEGQ